MRDLKLARWSGSRPTIGLVLNSVLDPRDSLVWSGAVEVAQACDINLVCLPGGYGDAPDTVLYDLVSSQSIDGLVIQLYTDLQEFLRIYQKFDSLPVVNTLRLYKGYPGVVADNYQGMRDVLQHLIQVHGYRRIAFIRGIEGNYAADERYRAYVDIVAEHHLLSDPDLVVASDLAQHFTEQGGQDAVRVLLDDRKKAIDVVVASADSTALGVTQALSARGIRVPYDIAVTGFDDIRQSRFSVPPLTTVAQPWHEMGKRAVELLLARLRGEEIPEQTVVPCSLVVRQSCKCWSSSVDGAGVDDAPATPGPTDRAYVLAETTRALGLGANHELVESIQPLMDAFSRDLRGAGPGVFLSALDTVLRQHAALGGDVSMWQDVLSATRRHFVSGSGSDVGLRSRADDLVGRARILVGETVQRMQVQQMAAAVEQAETIRHVGQAMISSLEVEGLSEVVAREMPRLGIPGFYLTLYEDPAEPASWSRMILAYRAQGGAELDQHGRRFPSRRLVPAGMLPDNEARRFLVEPLYVQQEHLGLALFELGPLNGPMYEALRGQLAAALRGVLLVRQTERRALYLGAAAEVGRVASSSILESKDLMQRVVDLVLERLDLYYAGIFLTDDSGAWTGESGRWAVLQAGTGQVGREMLAQGFKLEVGGASMVGQCIVHGEARIALDVGQEVERFDNPLLPHTHSELALPLRSRGQTIGAMTVQSSLPAAFGDEDVAALQLMADQLANATEAARLYADSQETIERVQILYETSRVLSSTLEETVLIDAILTAISQRMGCEYAVISVVDREGGAIESQYGMYHGEHQVFPEWMEASQYSLDGPGVWAGVYHTGKIELIEGWDERLDRDLYERFGHERLLRVFLPIQLGDRTMGVVEIGYDRRVRGHIDEQEIQLLRAIVDQAAVALENARLLAEVQQRLRREEALREMERMTRAVTDEIRAAVSVEDAVERTLGALGRSLGITELRARIGPADVLLSAAPDPQDWEDDDG